MAGEADLVDWWWEEQVKGGKQFAAEESIARKVSILMADDLTSEVSPDVIEGPAEAVESLIKNRVLRRTRDGRLRFDHDLLADWSRVMHLRSLGDSALTFMRTNTENPPWLRAIRLFSQHLLERSPDLGRWRSTVSACSVIAKGGKEPPANDLQVLDAWLEGIAYCTDSLRVLNSVRADLFAQNGWLLGRFIRRLLHTGTIPDPVIQQRFQQIDADAAEAAAMRFRLPQPFLWRAVLAFLIANPDHATDLIPVELAETGAMWARLEEYAGKAVEYGWSRNVLALQIEAGLHKRQGKAVTNFKTTLPPVQSDLAQGITKDPYLSDFLTLRDDANERAVEDGLVAHVEAFLLELGAGFALVGRQLRIWRWAIGIGRELPRRKIRRKLTDLAKSGGVAKGGNTRAAFYLWTK